MTGSPPQRRVVLTGATGLLGAYLARAFAADPGLSLTATRRPGSDASALADVPGIDWRTGDLGDVGFLDECLRGAGAVVHAAGLVSHDPRDARRLRRTNVDLTAGLVDAALAHEVPHFVYVSSTAALSPARRDAVADERYLAYHPQDDSSAYARSKFAGELEVWRGAEEGLGITILNPSIVLGVGDWQRSSARLITWVAKGQRYYPPGGTGYVDARDVAAFAKTCLDAGPAGRRYVVNAENWRFRRFFAAVAEAIGVSPPRLEAQPWQTELLWRGARVQSALTGGTPLLTKASARRSMRVLTYDNRASLKAGAQYRPLEQTVWDVGRAYAAAV